MSDDEYAPTYHLLRNVDEGTVEVMRLYVSDSHTLGDYLLASRKQWSDVKEATQYGIQLAKDNDLEFKHNRDLDPDSYQESLYLD